MVFDILVQSRRGTQAAKAPAAQAVEEADLPATVHDNGVG